MKQSKKGMLMAALICGTIAPVLFSGASVFAAEKDEKAVDEALQAFELNPMVITAQRTELSDLDTPAGTSVITAADIERSGAKTAYEIIERQVGITNNAYGPGGREYAGSATRTVLRGMDKGTLVLVNGVSINMLNYNSMEGIPVEAVEKIEIVRGAQAALYGAEAVGGVINIITKKGGKNKTTLSYGAGNFDQKLSVTSQGKGYFAHVSKDFYGKVNHTNFVGPKSNYDWKFRKSNKLNAFVSVSPIDKLTITAAHTEGKYYRDGMSPQYPGDTRHSSGKPGKYSYYYKDVRENFSISWDDKDNQFKSIIAYNKRDINPYSSKIENWKRFPMESNSTSNWRMETIGWNTQKGWDLRNGKDHLVAGFEIAKEKYLNKYNGKQKDDRTNYAIFASYKYQFSPKFSTTLGVRALHINDYADNQNAVLPQIQTLYKIKDNASWYINVGKSFEMPALNQYYNSNNPSPKSVKPQEGWTYETGVKFVNKANSWKFDIFHMDIDGKFDYRRRDEGDPNTSYMTNVGKWKNTGVELEYTQKLNDKLNMRFGIMYADPKKKDTDNSPYEQDEAKLQLTAGIDYKIGKFAANLNYLFVGKRQDAYYKYDGSPAGKNPDHKVPNRSLLNANFSYTADEHHSVQLRLNNIFDRDDNINKYLNWSMPFNWMLTYNYTF